MKKMQSEFLSDAASLAVSTNETILHGNMIN